MLGRRPGAPTSYSPYRAGRPRPRRTGRDRGVQLTVGALWAARRIPAPRSGLAVGPREEVGGGWGGGGPGSGTTGRRSGSPGQRRVLRGELERGPGAKVSRQLGRRQAPWVEDPGGISGVWRATRLGAPYKARGRRRNMGVTGLLGIQESTQVSSAGTQSVCGSLEGAKEAEDPLPTARLHQEVGCPSPALTGPTPGCGLGRDGCL